MQDGRPDTGPPVGAARGPGAPAPPAPKVDLGPKAFINVGHWAAKLTSDACRGALAVALPVTVVTWPHAPLCQPVPTLAFGHHSPLAGSATRIQRTVT